MHLRARCVWKHRSSGGRSHRWRNTSAANERRLTCPWTRVARRFKGVAGGRCWKSPYGQTRTYAQQAQAVGSPRAYRAVGMANHVNPLPVLIPCHRVVGADGSLTGYAGGLKIKRKLLEIEQSGKG